MIELMGSLGALSFRDFEIILVDGSPTDVLEEVDRDVSASVLSYKRIHVPGLGISESRNLGAKDAKGEFLIFLDSDVILPSHYLNAVDKATNEEGMDSFGGPDAAHPSFTDTQKAINYTMTSLLTTGGIRGKKMSVGTYRPRGFNFGVRKVVFDRLEGFNHEIKVGEDIDLSARIAAAGYKAALIPDAFVYHKRRVSLSKFYKQVFRFGAGRILLAKCFPEERKVTFLFPLVFVLGALVGPVLYIVSFRLFTIWCIGLGSYLFLNMLSATWGSKSIRVGLLAVPTLFVQFGAYANGFVQNLIAVVVLGRPDGIYTEKKDGPQSPE